MGDLDNRIEVEPTVISLALPPTLLGIVVLCLSLEMNSGGGELDQGMKGISGSDSQLTHPRSRAVAHFHNTSTGEMEKGRALLLSGQPV